MYIHIYIPCTIVIVVTNQLRKVWRTSKPPPVTVRATQQDFGHAVHTSVPDVGGDPNGVGEMVGAPVYHGGATSPW